MSRIDSHPWVARLLVLAVPCGVVAGALSTKSFWGDEILSIQFASRPIGELFAALAADYHPPLYFLMLKGWVLLFGSGEVGLRVFQGLQLGFYLYAALLLFRELFPGRRTHPFWILLALSAELWLFAPMLRYYTLAAALALASTVCFIRWLDSGRRLGLLLLSYVLLLHADYPSSIVIAVHLGFVAWKRRDRLGRLLLADLAAVLVLLPWAVVSIEQIRHLLRGSQVADFNASPFSLALKCGYSLYSFLMGETVYPFEPAALVVLAVTAGVILWVALRRRPAVGPGMTLGLAIAGIGVLFTSLLTTFISRHTSFIYTPSRTLFALAFVFAGLAFLYDSMGTSRLRRLFPIVLATAQGLGIVHWIRNEHFMMPVYALPWRTIAKDLEGSGGIAIIDESLCFRYYARRAPERYPRLVEPRSAAELAGVIERNRTGDSPLDVHVAVTGRESSEPEIPPEVLSYLEGHARLAGTRRYVPIDSAYRRLKSRLLRRDSYDAKLTLFHFVVGTEASRP